MTSADNLEFPLGGFVASGYEQTRSAFVDNFRLRNEKGAALAVFVDGQLVVDLWGGWADVACHSPWQEDTLLLVFSLTKGITALTVAKAHAMGLFSYDMPVAKLWPEFAQGGKGAITVRLLLDQQAGLPAMDIPLNTKNMSDPIAMAAQLAGQTPAWKPGDWAGNHAYTLGWLASELIRRSDPKGRTLGKFFNEEIAEPLGAEFYIGLPAQVSKNRLAELEGYRPISLALAVGKVPLGLIAAMAFNGSITSRTMNNPSVSKLAKLGPAQFNTPEYWALENGGSGGIGNARSIAKIYSAFANGGQKLDISKKTLAELEAPAKKPNKGWRDQVLKTDVRYSLAIEKPSPNNNFGTSDAAYGTFAIGGLYAFADPATKTSYCYVTNRPSPIVWGDAREVAVRDAVFADVGT